MPKLIGITGGIGAGKSFICKLLIKMGYPVFDSDKEAKKIMLSNKSVIQEIKNIFGEESYIDGKLNTKYLAEKIFNNSSLMAQLNQIVHPAVKSVFEEWVKSQKVQLVFNESAILFETGRYKDFDATILVTAPEKIRIERVIQRDNTTYEAVKNRIDSQWSDEEKEKLASFTIINDGFTPVKEQIENIIESCLNSTE